MGRKLMQRFGLFLGITFITDLLFSWARAPSPIGSDLNAVIT